MRKRAPPQPASLSFQPASSKERVLLQNLAQFYSYDFSEVLEMHIDDDGRFGDLDLTPYWEDEWRHPFLFRVDDKLAGFALISEPVGGLGGEPSGSSRSGGSGSSSGGVDSADSGHAEDARTSGSADGSTEASSDAHAE